MSYVIFMLLLSFSFMSAGNQRVEGFNATTNEYGDPRVYNDGEARLRAICEVAIILALIYTVYDECREFVR